MGRVNTPVAQSFLGGEIGPRSYGRTDLPQWNHSYETLLNFITQPQGSATRRPGFKYIKGTQGTQPARLIPFIYSQAEAYQVEIATDDAAPTVRVIDVNTPSSVATPSLTLTGVTSTLPIWTAAAIKQIQYAQSADITWLVNGSFKPMMLVRTAAGAWSMCDVVRNVNGIPNTSAWPFRYGYAQPFRPVNTTATTLQPSVTTGNGTLTASAPYFVAGMVGSYYKVTQTDTGNRFTGMCLITGFTSELLVNITVIDAFVNTTADADWEESSWSPYRGYPRSTCLFEGRLYYGGNTAEPDRVWASQSQNVSVMDARGFNNGGSFPTVTNASAYSFVPNVGQVNSIQWMAPGKNLPVGSLGNEFVCKGPDPSLSLGVSNITMTPETAHGSAYVQAVKTSYMITFVQRSIKKLRELAFDFTNDSYIATDIALHAKHLFKAAIQGLAWQEFPNGVFWAFDANGQLIGLTRERQQQIISWHRHKIGGAFSTGVARVISVSCVPLSDGTDQLWVVVKRTINGSTAYYVEAGSAEFDATTITAADCTFMDSWYRGTNGTAISLITGMTHLVGQTVKVVSAATVGGAMNYDGEFVVDGSGQVQLPATRLVKEWVVGLGYTSQIKTLKMNTGSQIGSAMGAWKRTDKLLLRLFDTWGLKYGSSSADLKDIIFWGSDHPETITLFTGDKYLDFPDGWDQDGQVLLETDAPFPCNVDTIVARATVNET